MMVRSVMELLWRIISSPKHKIAATTPNNFLLLNIMSDNSLIS